MRKWPIQKQILRTTRNTENNKTEQTSRINISFGIFSFLYMFFYLKINKLVISPRNVELPPSLGFKYVTNHMLYALVHRKSGRYIII